MTGGLMLPLKFAKLIRTSKCCLLSGNPRTLDMLQDAHERGLDFDILVKPVHPSVIIDRLKAMSVMN
jgi:hypothetical protein